MLLNDEQKTTFARWLEAQIISSEGIAAQMDTINQPHMAMLAKKELEEAMACKIVLKIITSGESMSVGAAGKATGSTA